MKFLFNTLDPQIHYPQSYTTTLHDMG